MNQGILLIRVTTSLSCYLQSRSGMVCDPLLSAVFSVPAWLMLSSTVRTLKAMHTRYRLSRCLAHRGRSHSEILPRAEGTQPTHWRVPSSSLKSGHLILIWPIRRVGSVLAGSYFRSFQAIFSGCILHFQAPASGSHSESGDHPLFEDVRIMLALRICPSPLVPQPTW
jgi:hypothetical protein